MKFSIVAIAAFCGLAAASKASVVNQCSSSIYVQSFPYGNGSPGKLTEVKPGKTFSEDFRRTGSTVKIAKTRTLTDPLFFGYSFSASGPKYAYYELSSEWGNPFKADRVTLSPGSGCTQFNCGPNNANCYSRPSSKKVYGCPEPVNLTATICKK